MEKWAPVVGFKNYEISSLGRLRSINPRKGARVNINGGILKGWLQLGNRNYPRHMYALRKDGKTYCWKAHQLVLNAFIGPCPTGRESLHINGNSLDNNLSNLRYGTHRENIHDAIAHGTHSKPPIHYGTSHHMARLSSDEVHAIQSCSYYRGLYAYLARQHKTTIQTISRIHTKRSRTNG